MNAIASPATQPSGRVIGLLHELERRQPHLAVAAQIALVAVLPCLIAMQVDPRLINGISVWVKPVKFLLSFVMYYATLAWFFGYLPRSAQDSRAGRFVIHTAIAVGALEMLWLLAAAANGVPSHFNTGSLVWGLAYSAAGVGSVLLITVILVQGLMIGRDRRIALAPVFRAAVVAGSMIAFAATLVVAGTLSAGDGHWVGGAASDAAGLPLIGWSRTGGDLRVAHFWALHAQQFVPLAGALIAAVAPRRPHAVLALAVIGYLGLIVFAFLQALAGQPFVA